MVSFQQIRQKLFQKPSASDQEQNFPIEESNENEVRNVYVRRWYSVQLAGVIGAFAVAMGAYGAHALHPRGDIPDIRKQIFDTGNFYHFIHALALLGVPLTNRPTLVSTLLILGMIIFCGTCYVTGITGNTFVAMFTPYGGIALILGWTCMIL